MEFGLLILRRIVKNCCHQMSDFKAKMHQIRFRLGLRPRPHWGSLQRSPDPLAGFKWPWKGGIGREGRGRGKGERRGREGGKGGDPRVYL